MIHNTKEEGQKINMSDTMSTIGYFANANRFNSGISKILISFFQRKQWDTNLLMNGKMFTDYCPKMNAIVKAKA